MIKPSCSVTRVCALRGTTGHHGAPAPLPAVPASVQGAEPAHMAICVRVTPWVFVRAVWLCVPRPAPTVDGERGTRAVSLAAWADRLEREAAVAMEAVQDWQLKLNRVPWLPVSRNHLNQLVITAISSLTFTEADPMVELFINAYPTNFVDNELIYCNV